MTGPIEIDRYDSDHTRQTTILWRGRSIINWGHDNLGTDDIAAELDRVLAARAEREA